MITVIFAINSTFPFYSGGRENWLHHVCNFLANSGFDVHVVALRGDKASPQHYSLDTRVHLHTTSTWTMSLVGRILTIGSLRFLRTIAPAWSLRRLIKKLLYRIPQKPILIQLDTVVTPLATRDFGDQIITICASKGPHAEVLSEQHPRLTEWFFKLELRSYRECDELWSNGHDMSDYIKKQGYHSLMIGNGVDTEGAQKQYSTPPDMKNSAESIKIVSVGSLLDIKGIANAIRALSLIEDINIRRNSQLYFVGKGDSSRYRALAEKLLIGQNVHFLGAKNLVFPYMQQAHMLLCLSGGGGLSMAALESLATGTPVIAWDTPVYRQMITHGTNGFLVPFGDNRALSKTIEMVAKMDTDKLALIKKSALEKSQEFDWANVFSRIQERLHALSASASV